jgi:dihydrofolate reductase
MSVFAGITTSIDGYIAGPDDGPGKGLGEGGERLHYWVFGGPWTYEAARHWGDENPWGIPFFVVTHRPEEQPEGDQFTFVAGVQEAVARAREAAGDKDVHVMGGADVLRQALDAGLVDELSIIVAPVILGGGKLLFEGFTKSLDLTQLGVRQSEYATFIDYRVN